MQKEHRDRYIVKRSAPGRGKGLFAQVPIKKGEFIIEYTGTRIPTDVADTLTTRYLFDLEDGTTLDGSAMSNTARWMNHSCAPNCEALLEDGRIMLYAEKNIAAGDELTFDYGEEYFNIFLRPIGCKCSRCEAAASAKKSSQMRGARTR